MKCGSREIQMMAWVDPNTSECTSTIDADSDDRWCDTCQEHVWFCSLAEFRQRLDAWWESTDHSKKEEITGLCRTDFPAGDDCRAFVEACNAWWREHDYEGRRALWMELTIAESQRMKGRRKSSIASDSFLAEFGHDVTGNLCRLPVMNRPCRVYPERCGGRYGTIERSKYYKARFFVNSPVMLPILSYCIVESLGSRIELRTNDVRI